MRRRRSPEDREPERIGDLLVPLLKELRTIGRRVGRDLHEAWLDVAGPDLGSRTRLHSFRSGRLVVEVDSAALLHELQSFRAPVLLERLRERMPRPCVAELRFRLGAFGAGGPTAN
jgi:predicted nucleic acid-binding Zn ribbon protein